MEKRSLEIEHNQFDGLLKNNKDQLLILDVREPWEYDIVHFEDSVLWNKVDIPPLDHYPYVVIICHHGVRSLNFASRMQSGGFVHVQSLKGGIDGWSLSKDPSFARY